MTSEHEESAILNSSQIASQKISMKTGKSSKLLNMLMGRLTASKLNELGLNTMVMDEVKNEINEQMRNNRTSYRADEELSSTVKKLQYDKDGGIELTLVYVDLNLHHTARLRLSMVKKYLSQLKSHIHLAHTLQTR